MKIYLLIIRILNAAYEYPQYNEYDIKVPTLDEVLDEFKDNENLCFFFDVKDIKVVPMLTKVILY